MLLPFERRYVLLEHGFGGGDGGVGGVEIGLGGDGIEPRQNLAGLDMLADIDLALDHAAGDAERQVGADAGGDFAGQRNRRRILGGVRRRHAHRQRRALDDMRRVAGAEPRRHDNGPKRRPYPHRNRR